MQRAAESAADAARLEGRPEITLGANVNLSPMARERMYGLEPVMPVVGLSLPLWRSGIRAESRSNGSEPHVRIRSIRRDRALRSEVNALLTQLDRTEDRIGRLARSSATARRSRTRIDPDRHFAQEPLEQSNSWTSSALLWRSTSKSSPKSCVALNSCAPPLHPRRMTMERSRLTIIRERFEALSPRRRVVLIVTRSSRLPVLLHAPLRRVGA
jgi:hypothetical protein